MTRRGPDERRQVAVDPGLRHGLHWTAERHGKRYLFIGPVPGRFVFTSVEATGWDAAITAARNRWNTQDTVKRDAWYGPEGRYTKFQNGSK